MYKIQKGAIYAFFTLTVPEVLRNHRHSVWRFLKTTRVGKYLVLSLFTEVLRNHRHSVGVVSQNHPRREIFGIETNYKPVETNIPKWKDWFGLTGSLSSKNEFLSPMLRGKIFKKVLSKISSAPAER